MRRTLAAAVFTALSIATAGAQLTIPKEYLPKVHGTIRSKYELQTTTGMQRFQVRNARVSLDGKVQPELSNNPFGIIVGSMVFPGGFD